MEAIEKLEGSFVLTNDFLMFLNGILLLYSFRNRRAFIMCARTIYIENLSQIFRPQRFDSSALR